MNASESGGPPIAAATSSAGASPARYGGASSCTLNSGWRDAADVKEQLNGVGAEPAVMTPDEFTRYIQAEMEKWGLAVKLSGAKVD